MDGDAGVRGDHGGGDDVQRDDDGDSDPVRYCKAHKQRPRTAQLSSSVDLLTASESKRHSSTMGRGSLATCGDVHPNPGPYLRFLQWNAAGLTDNKRSILLAHLSDIDVALVQETHRQTLTIPGFDVYHAA
eukprot:PhM_4_TR10483/c0_g1_i2/m.36623